MSNETTPSASPDLRAVLEKTLAAYIAASQDVMRLDGEKDKSKLMTAMDDDYIVMEARAALRSPSEPADEVPETMMVLRDLAELASYAEIVGGIRVNRPQIRQRCDRAFAIIRADEVRRAALQGQQPQPATGEG